MKEKKYIEITELPNFEIEADISIGEKLGRSKFILLPYEHLSDIPLADVKEIEKASMVKSGDTRTGYLCTNCKTEVDPDSSYCKRCGAEFISDGPYWIQKRSEIMFHTPRGERLRAPYSYFYLECPNCQAVEEYNTFDTHCEIPRFCPECKTEMKGVR